MFGKKKVVEEEVIDQIGGEEEIVKKSKKKLPGWVIVPILVVLALGFWGISALSSPKSSGTELSVVTVKKGDVKETYSASGKVESEKEKVFYSPVNAPILACNAKVGTAVKAGELLVAFDTKDLERENQKSELSEQSTKYTNQDALEQSRRSADAAAQAQAQAAKSTETLKQQIADKQAQVAKLQTAYDQASADAGANAEKANALQSQMEDNLKQQSAKGVEKENSQRNLDNIDVVYPDLDVDERAAKKQELVNTINTLTQEIEDLKNTYRELEGQLNSVGGTDVTGAAQALASVRQELEALKTSLSQAASGGQAAETGVTKAQLNNMAVSENLAELATLSTEELVAKGKEGIKAEFDGIIADVKAVEGSAAVQGGELFTLVSNQDVSVKLQVSANDFDKMKVGSEATIKLGDSNYKGVLKEIDKIALPNEKGNPVIGVTVHIENPDENIYIGVTAKVSMIVAEKKNVLYLPSEVVNTGTEGDFVYIVSGGTVKKQMIELGVNSASRVEVTAGLSEGAQVVADTMGTIKDGMKVSAVKEETK